MCVCVCTHPIINCCLYIMKICIVEMLETCLKPFQNVYSNGFFLWKPLKRDVLYYPQENEHIPKKGTISKGNVIFQPSIFRGCVSLQGGK